MNDMNRHEEALRNLRRIAAEDPRLSHELDSISQIRSVTREVAKDHEGSYRLPYTSRPDFIGERWRA